MNPRDVPKPARIAALDEDERGYVKFFMILPPPGRELHFRVLNYENVLKCGTHKLCGICGLTLSYRFWFLGSREDVADRLFPSPPFHRDCLDYALRVCPFLAGIYTPKHQELGPQFVHAPLTETRRGDFGLYCTRSFTVSVKRGQPVFRVAPATTIEWRTMPEVEHAHPE